MNLKDISLFSILNQIAKCISLNSDIPVKTTKKLNMPSDSYEKTIYVTLPPTVITTTVIITSTFYEVNLIQTDLNTGYHTSNSKDHSIPKTDVNQYSTNNTNSAHYNLTATETKTEKNKKENSLITSASLVLSEPYSFTNDETSTEIHNFSRVPLELSTDYNTKPYYITDPPFWSCDTETEDYYTSQTWYDEPLNSEPIISSQTWYDDEFSTYEPTPTSQTWYDDEFSKPESTEISQTWCDDEISTSEVTITSQTWCDDSSTSEPTPTLFTETEDITSTTTSSISMQTAPYKRTPTGVSGKDLPGSHKAQNGTGNSILLPIRNHWSSRNSTRSDEDDSLDIADNHTEDDAKKVKNGSANNNLQSLKRTSFIMMFIGLSVYYIMLF